MLRIFVRLGTQDMTLKLIGLTSTLAIVATGAVAEMNFNRIASFATASNNADAAAESSSEIIAVSADGMTLA